MGCRPSKTSAENSSGSRRQSSSSGKSTLSDSDVSPGLASYESACRSDPDLQTFDSAIQGRTSRVINSLADGAEVQLRSLSLDSLREVSDGLLEMNQEVAEVILECKEDIWKNKELFALVKDYFDNSLLTLDFCTSLENCLKRARESQLIVQVVLNRFEAERRQGSSEYLQTLEQLKSFRSAGELFDDEFFDLFQSVYKNQVSMFKKLRIKCEKIDRKLKSAKTWRRVSNVIFVATFTAVLICSVVAAAISAPPVLTALAAAAAVPLGSMGKWLNSIWSKYENELKGQKEIIGAMKIGTFIVIKDLDTIKALVKKLEDEMDGLLQNAEFGIREGEEAVVVVVDEIRSKVNGFAKTIEELSEHSDKCSRDIRKARTLVLQKIIKHPSNSL